MSCSVFLHLFLPHSFSIGSHAKYNNDALSFPLHLLTLFMKRNTSNIPQIQMVSPHQLHPLQFLKETDPEHLGWYTRRGLATVTHALLALWNVACVVSIFCLILGPSLRGH